MRKSAQQSPRRELLLRLDRSYLERGVTSLAGVDEAGRGPLAGPVVASAVIVRDFSFDARVDDSKKLSAAARAGAYDEILSKCEVGIGVVGSAAIDRDNILEATMRAMEQAVMKLGCVPDLLLVDGVSRPRLPFKLETLIDGDARSFSIACASIIAKVTRDRMMDHYDAQYPVYGFAKHKGYGTQAHMAALKKYGPCEIHRKSFAPVRNAIMNCE